MTQTIANYYAYNGQLSAGAQPTTEQFADLKNNNFDVIVNISPVSARNALQSEAAVVEQLGMDYVHFPVDCSNLRPVHYLTFEGIMNGLQDKKVFVHCGGNIKSSNLIHMYHVLATGMDEKASLGSLYQIQQPEEKWFSYFRTMGMQGLK